ncbi:hypothetical protein PF010_g10330 [Phytophthora fragariae]|uniref:Uncharacterized protein n=1 Tax=Phytophthora fragariae TaxID=53985 RepID=A0A6A3KUW7_9STRA|nr:hypothetical protein PF011_g9756 [Phytophthora fragariae]KAE9112760.1 hypothetical protein PF010_g10330 [Phytophthora fragariae]
MQHLGAARVNRKRQSRVSTGSAALPDGWFPIEPQVLKNGKARGRPGPDVLGLANTVDPLTFLAQKPNERSVNGEKQQQNPRRRRLRASGASGFPVAEAFSPQRSLRLAKLPLLKTRSREEDVEVGGLSNQLLVKTPTQMSAPRDTELPLHELIQTMDDAVKADPSAELNQSSIARLFMNQWLRQFEADRRSYKSVAVRFEVGFEELQRRTVNLPRPNDLITTFCCKVLEDLTPHFGPYASLFRVLSAELIQSIYARDGLPYFALVKHHKRLLLTLRKDKEWREERNEVLSDDIGKVYSMFLRFLTECTYALSRMLFHEWHSIAIVQKKNNRKYVAYFSNWFSNSPKAILGKVFVAWKREAAMHRIEKIQKQMQIDFQALAVVKRQVDDLTRQRDIAQADNLTMRSDRKQAEEWARTLELRIKAASSYLDTTRRREAQVCQEGQLRVEAVACLPPLILESLLRGYHGVGFLQQAPVQVQATEYGSLLFSPADMSAFTHNAYLHPASGKSELVQAQSSQDLKKGKPSEGKARSTPTPSPAQSSLSLAPADTQSTSSVVIESSANTNNSLRNILPIVTAYDTWNQISEQLISGNVVQSRGLTPKVVVDPNESISGDLLRTQGVSSGIPIRPMLRHQFEPLSHSSFLVSTRDKSGRRTSITTGDGNTFHTARIRHLTAEGPDRLLKSIETIHASVKTTSAKMKDFQVTHQQLRELRVTQWQTASELASQFATKQSETLAPAVAVGQLDHREHVYECISLTNNTMRRIFSVEENPDAELTRVRAVLEKHHRVIRQLYTPFRANVKHAMSLDDLWHIVKILRLPREIHVLPILRDEEMVANGYEQLFSPEDLAELVLQLCNEQFQSQIAPLSARVDYFVTQHLTIATQNRSLVRTLMHRPDVKLAIGSHSQTIRIIFRRYCAKEREMMTPANGPTKLKLRHTAPRINKYMRMIDWQAFVQEYHLVRARFSMDQAMNVFRNVQEAPPGSDDQLELIYSEFCEALVGMAMFYFPDPFLKTATKVTQFLRRYLPLTPDEDHA